MQKYHIASHVSITGLFIVVMLILAIPLVVLTTQNPQDIRQRASELPSPVPSSIPTRQTGYISGYVYLDLNQDGQRDYNETGAPNIQIKLTPLDKLTPQSEITQPVQIVFTDQNGYFKHPVSYPSSNQYTHIIEVVLPQNHKTINTNPHTFSDIEDSTKEILEFGIFPLGNVKGISTSATPTIYGEVKAR